MWRYSRLIDVVPGDLFMLGKVMHVCIATLDRTDTVRRLNDTRDAFHDTFHPNSAAGDMLTLTAPTSFDERLVSSWLRIFNSDVCIIIDTAPVGPPAPAFA